MIIKITLQDDKTQEIIDKRVIIHPKTKESLKIAKSYITKKLIGVE
jgi:hypothetical protein